MSTGPSLRERKAVNAMSRACGNDSRASVCVLHSPMTAARSHVLHSGGGGWGYCSWLNELPQCSGMVPLSRDIAPPCVPVCTAEGGGVMPAVDRRAIASQPRPFNHVRVSILRALPPRATTARAIGALPALPLAPLRLTEWYKELTKTKTYRCHDIYSGGGATRCVSACLGALRTRPKRPPGEETTAAHCRSTNRTANRQRAVVGAPVAWPEVARGAARVSNAPGRPRERPLGHHRPLAPLQLHGHEERVDDSRTGGGEVRARKLHRVHLLLRQAGRQHDAECLRHPPMPAFLFRLQHRFGERAGEQHARWGCCKLAAPSQCLLLRRARANRRG